LIYLYVIALRDAFIQSTVILALRVLWNTFRHCYNRNRNMVQRNR